MLVETPVLHEIKSRYVTGHHVTGHVTGHVRVM